MLKNTQRKLKNLFRNKIQDTTKEWEEVGERRPLPRMSKALLVIDRIELIDRIKFLFTVKIKYRLAEKEITDIKNI